MSSNEAPSRKKAKYDPTTIVRQQIGYLMAHPGKDPLVGQRASPKDRLPPPPDFVNHVQGSSSGAGSGEFHVYKESRRREYERVAIMDAKNQEEREQLEFQFARAERQRLDEEKTEKNRLKREKAKAAKLKAIQAEKERKAATRAITPQSSLQEQSSC